MKQNLITEYFKPEIFDEVVINISDNKDKDKVYGYNKKTGEWNCIECGTNLGTNNPRQLCGKNFCFYGV